MVEIKTTPGKNVYVNLHGIKMGVDYLSDVSDECLTGTIAHALGHVKTLRPLLFDLLVKIFILMLLFYTAPLWSMPLVCLGLYLMYCHHLRISEYMADVYALKYCGYKEMVTYFREGATKHSGLSCLPVVRWFNHHPDISKRYDRLCKTGMFV